MPNLFLAPISGTGAVLDRSVFSDCVFANVCKSEGYISEDGKNLKHINTTLILFSLQGYKEYKFWRQKALENLPLPHLTIFLNASPQCCHKRIHTRGRVSVRVGQTALFCVCVCVCVCVCSCVFVF